MKFEFAFGAETECFSLINNPPAGALMAVPPACWGQLLPNERF